MIKLFSANLVILLLFTIAFTQQINKPVSKKVVLYNGLAFSHEKTGIKKLVEAEAQATNPGFVSETDTKKLAEIQKETYKRREKIIVEPVRNQISALLKQVETQNNIILIDGAKIEEEGLLLSFDLRFDVTKQLITYFNNKSENPDETLKLTLPESKIAVINTEMFYEKQKGIKSLSKSTDNSAEVKKTCIETSICGEIFKSIFSFGNVKGYSLVLDSSKYLPVELSGHQMTGITQEFINEYNSNH